MRLVTKTVPIDSLKEHPRNPRRGNVAAIAESLRVNGQYTPLTVQKSTNYIIKGNHTWKAARAIGMKTISVVYVDVDDETAMRILVGDNHIPDTGDYDFDVLAQILEDLPSYEGTGYTQEEIDLLLATIRDVSEQVASEISGQNQEVVDESLTTLFGEEDLGDGVDDLESYPTVLPDSRALFSDPNRMFPSSNEWGIPDLREDRLMTEVPPNFQSWAGPKVTQDTGVEHWFYTFSSDSTHGMPWERTTLNFYTHDDRFIQWWTDPETQFTRALNAGVTSMAEPDFSVSQFWPKVVRMHSVFRNRWIARYAQEVGMTVLPSISWGTPGDEGWVLAGYPKELPVVCMEVQSYYLSRNDRAVRNEMAEWLLTVERVLKPKVLLAYGSPKSFPLVKDVMHETEVVYVQSRSSRRDEYRSKMKISTPDWQGKR